MIFYSKDVEELYMSTNTNFNVGDIRKAFNNIEWKDEDSVHLYCDNMHNRIVFCLLETKPDDEKEWIDKMCKLFDAYGTTIKYFQSIGVCTISATYFGALITGGSRFNPDAPINTNKTKAIAMARALGEEIPDYIMEV